MYVIVLKIFPTLQQNGFAISQFRSLCESLRSASLIKQNETKPTNFGDNAKLMTSTRRRNNVAVMYGLKIAFSAIDTDH